MAEEKKVIGPFDPEVIYNLSEQEKVSDKDDATYKTDDPDFFEWWYFDVHSDQGYTIVVALLDRDFSNMQMPPIPKVRIDIETPEKENFKIDKEYPDLKWEVSKERCDVKLGDQFSCSGTYPVYRLKAEDGDVAMDLEFVATLPGWRPGTGTDYFSSDRSKFFGWVVAQPRASVTGTLKIGNKKINVTGIGYHDHNYGTVPLAGHVANWHWGRTYAGEYTLIFSTLVTATEFGRRVIPVFMLGKGSEILLSSGEILKTEHGHIETVPETGNRYAEKVVFRIPYKNDFVELKLTNTKMLDEWDFAPELPIPDGMGKPGYFRLLADLDMTIPLDKGVDRVTGVVIHEYMLLEMTKYE